MPTQAVNAGKAAANATAKAIVNPKVALKNPVMVALSLAAMGAAGMMIKDSYDGTRLKRRDAAAGITERNQYSFMNYGWGFWSGFPMMDKLAQKVRSMTLFGPLSLGLKWQQFKYNVNSMVNDVVLPNLVPIGVAVGSLYAAFGKKSIHSAVGSLLAPLKKLSVPSSLAEPLKQMTKNGLAGIGKGVAKLASKAISSPKNLFMTLGGMIFGGFALNRFSRVYSRQAEQDYFRDYVSTRNEKY